MMNKRMIGDDKSEWYISYDITDGGMRSFPSCRTAQRDGTAWSEMIRRHSMIWYEYEIIIIISKYDVLYCDI